MFKKKFGGGPAKAVGSGVRLNTSSHLGCWHDRNCPNLCFLILLVVLLGCRTVPPPLPALDLKQLGWTVQEGQAVWHLPHGVREIAGEVLVASRPGGHSFVQFSKSPFQLVIAQAGPNQWEAEFPPQNKRYAGRGVPPKRLIWLYLPRVLAGEPPPKGWSWTMDPNGWKLENRPAGESVEGYFSPPLR
jgi:hypothetical protein